VDGLDGGVLRGRSISVGPQRRRLPRAAWYGRGRHDGVRHGRGGIPCGRGRGRGRGLLRRPVAAVEIGGVYRVVGNMGRLGGKAMQICGRVRVAGWWDGRARAGVVEGGGGYVVERVDVVLLLLVWVRREGREGRLRVEGGGVLEVVEAVEAVEERAAGARNRRLVSETAMVHGVVVLLVPPPITLSLSGRSPVGLAAAAVHTPQASGANRICGFPKIIDVPCGQLGGVHGWRVGRRGRSTLMRWQARGLAGLGCRGNGGQPARAWEQPGRRNKLEPPLQSQGTAPLHQHCWAAGPGSTQTRQAPSSHSNPSGR
jgi:hypothetical protein